MKCIQCGKKEAVIEYQCMDCYLKNNPVIKKIPSKIRVSVCRKCGVFFHEHNESKSILELIDRLLYKNIIYDKKHFTIEDIKSRVFMHDDYQGEIETNIIGEINTNPVSLPLKIPLHLKDSLCRKCARLSSNYFEGTLQIRTLSIMPKGIVQFAKKTIKGMGAAVTNEAKVTNGYDLMITDSQAIKETVYLLRKKYGGEVKISRTLFSRNKQTSKDIYRITALLRLPDFSIGDIMVTNKRILLIKSIDDYRVSGINIINMKKSQIDYKDVDYWIIKKSEIKKSIISKTSPHVEVIDNDDYQPKRAKNNPSKELKQGQGVNIVKIDDEIWLLP